MSTSPLSLHFNSLTAHVSSLSRIIVCVDKLVSPAPPGFHGAHVGETRRVLHALVHALTKAAAALSALAPTAAECSVDARSILYENQQEQEAAALQNSLKYLAVHIAAQLSEISEAFRQVAGTIENATLVVGESEREFARCRGPLGLAVVSSEDSAATARKNVLDAGRRVSELDGILADARRDESAATRDLFFARCVGMVRGRGLRRAVIKAKKTRDVVDRAARDRVLLIKNRADVQSTYLRRSAEARRIQRELIEKDDCWKEAVDVYGALRSMSDLLREVAGLWEGLALSCAEVAERQADYSQSENDSAESSQTHQAERWHTISVALRLFLTDHIDATQRVLRLLEQ